MSSAHQKKQRVMIAFDGDNFRDMIRTTGPIDVTKLREVLTDDRHLSDITFFISVPAEGRLSTEQYGFIMTMRQAGIRVKTHRRQKKTNSADDSTYEVGYPDGFVFTHIMRNLAHFDTLILVTRDGDYAFLLDYLSNDMGKHVEVCGITFGMSWELLNQAQRFWNLGLMMQQQEDLRYTKPERPNNGKLTQERLFPTGEENLGEEANETP